MASFGALALLLAFGLLGRRAAGGLHLRGDAREPVRRRAWPASVLCLALVGAGSKAGLAPLHVWLPLAHPAAPSHVSALMSGVMTKVAVYAFVRIAFDLARAAGLVVERRRCWRSAERPAVIGVLHALMQTRPQAPARLSHDREHRPHLHRARARARLQGERHAPAGGAGADRRSVARRSIIPLFKSLLFFGAGAVLTATGERDMEQLGGLLNRMPATGVHVPGRLRRRFRRCRRSTASSRNG